MKTLHKMMLLFLIGTSIALLTPMIASAADQSTCDHDWQIVEYKMIDDQYHQVKEICNKCYDTRWSDQYLKHEPYSYVDRYENIDSEHHQEIFKCRDCGADIKGDIVEHVYYESEDYQYANDEYHCKIEKCRECDATRPSNKYYKHENYWGEATRCERIDDEHHQEILLCDECNAEYKGDIQAHKYYECEDGFLLLCRRGDSQGGDGYNSAGDHQHFR